MGRPSIVEVSTGARLRRWYWTKEELVTLAKVLGVPTGGSKLTLTGRLCAALDGTAFVEPPATGARGGHQLRPPVDRSTVLPAGQRSSQVLREFFEKEIGGGFRFDGFMRGYIANNPGKTLGDVIDYWYRTRGEAGSEKPIAEQFEYNAFMRHWYRENPGGDRKDATASWYSHRSKPKN